MQILWTRYAPAISCLLIARWWRIVSNSLLLHIVAGESRLSTRVPKGFYYPLLIGIALMLTFIEDNRGTFLADSTLWKAIRASKCVEHHID
jgi:hypothetical protein